MKRGEETKEKIIQAALQLFIRKGYHGTSIHEITQKTDLSKGAFYAHFRTKGELVIRLIKQYEAECLQGMRKSVDECKGDALDKLNRIISFNAKFSTKRHDLLVFLTYLTTELKADVDFEPVLRNVYRVYQNIVSEIIKTGIRQGIFRKEVDPDLAALTFMALHDGVLHQYALNRQYTDGELFVKTFRNIILFGLVEQIAA